MLTMQFLETVIRADKIAVSSDLNEQGQSLTCAWNICNIELLTTWTHSIPIEHWEVPKLITELSV